MRDRNPLGRGSAYPEHYAPDLLTPIPRAAAREQLGTGTPLPFRGEDLWNAWELTWLGADGKPRIGTGAFRIPADSDNLVESKSLKLYLNSLAMSRFASVEEFASVIAGDLSNVTAKPVGVSLAVPPSSRMSVISELPGESVDEVTAACDTWEVDASLLACADTAIVSEDLHSHLLRSNCPVTGQPDMGSVLVRYRGPRIDRSALLRYIVSYRRHCAFHESCVERMFLDIKARCEPECLTVYARYNRRGGIDINPFRSDFEDAPENRRLWRQ